MTDIDEATGLPALPEGHWWEVSEEKDVFNGVSYPKHYELHIYKKITVQPAQEYVSGSWGKRGYWFTPEATEGNCRVNTTKVLNTDLEGKPPSEPGWMVGVGRSDYLRPYDLASKLTPSGLLHAAERLLAEAEQRKVAAERRQAEAAGTESLLGAYPPKSLAVAR